ncbi:uncharacterized protein MONOS_12663 [Monocercomonoides exilis]|uniref:uncharacterized protein n=1 Tax=Monocercomonoides exilis TaxID=2049356 RepID=UPI00355A885F|nr:hypothetical protein MONOS_12663 [Monocercomonoides exilis]|eukprot:MONOS_12663.1-p1 / transcript=MONOS_12663.1 / gene=MONOS_12663 / organism=Monocercomonoides_exilis_PA203 / gene_product=unspecified product / transcript_product=unspecified product / location=Mono_scaffold00716:13760-14696(-) / protein_length=270 / sequence_SO=supercontig / SO=protein_coding / is_pseudo=false
MIQKNPLVKIDFEIFSELEQCNGDEQKLKILKMKGIMEKMNKEELKSIMTTELFDRLDKLIEEKKMTLANTIFLLKCMGYCNALKCSFNLCYERSLLHKRFEKMIIDEAKKKKGKKEKLLIDLDECYSTLCNGFSFEFLSICVPCILKVVLNKVERKESRDEVEMAFLSLSNIEYEIKKIGKNQYLKEMIEIINCYQQNHNLTRLAYQSAWKFLIFRLWSERSLEDVIADDLHFAREATRELEELAERVDWSKREEREREWKNILCINR